MKSNPSSLFYEVCSLRSCAPRALPVLPPEALAESASRRVRRPSLSPRGFTLVELLVVITIIGILIALLLQAAREAAREAARRLQCQNHLKQLGLAVLNYEHAIGTFPPSSTWDVDAGVSIQVGNNSRLGPNWVILVLPHLEQQAIYDKFLANVPRYIPSAANAMNRAMILSVMLCPSDPFNQTPFDGSANSGTRQLGDNWARGNYAANASLGQMNDTFCCDYGNGVLNCAATVSSYGWKSDRLRGVMGANAVTPTAKIFDGLSNTILIGEIRAGLYAGDPRGVWAMSGGASALWGHGSYMGDCSGPNSPGLGCDDVTGCTQIISDVGGYEVLVDERMTCFDIGWHNQQAVRSQYANGAYVCLGDGSVQWISDFIDVAGNITANPPRYSVWDRLNLSADGAQVTANAF